MRLDKHLSAKIKNTWSIRRRRLVLSWQIRENGGKEGSSPRRRHR